MINLHGHTKRCGHAGGGNERAVRHVDSGVPRPAKYAVLPTSRLGILLGAELDEPVFESFRQVELSAAELPRRAVPADDGDFV